MTDIISASAPASTTAPASQLHGASLSRLIRAFARVCLVRPVNVLMVWQARLQQRQALAEMEAERLDDMGIGRTAARREAAKPFWRA